MKRSEIAQLLPEVFQRTLKPGEPLAGLLEVMEGLHASSEDALATFDAYLDPYRCPDAFVPFLARWVDLDRFLSEGPDTHFLSSGLGRLRELVAAAAFLAKWRGTAKGLLNFLEIATGLQGFAVDELVTDGAGSEKPFHLRVRAPSGAEAYRELIVQIVEMEKPAYVTYDLVFTTG